MPALSFEEILKFNENHDRLGRFSSAAGGAGAQTAHDRLNALEDKGFGMVKTPIPLVSSKKDGWDVQDIWNGLKAKQKKGLPVQEVNLSEVKTWQTSVARKGVKKLLDGESPESSSKHPIAVRYKGQLVLVDGNHRVAAAILNEEKTMKIAIYDPGQVGKSFLDVLSPEETSKKEMTDFTVFKADEDKRLVFGWASIVITVNGEELEDRQHDIIDPEDLEEAAYEYVLNFRDTGEEHLPGYRKKGKLVESVVLTKEKQKAMGIPDGVLPVGWWIGFKIDDEDTWQRVKNGTYKMFSIEGKAQREPVEKAQPTGCGVLVIRDGKILTGTRNDRKGICGPGGHVEEGETPEEAAKREAFEEFGITCNDLQPLGVQDGGRHGTSAVFLCTDYEGVPKTDEEEMTDLQWRTIGELKDAELFPPFAQSLELLPERKTVAKTFSDVLKFNPYHDSLGRFSSGGSAASFTFQTRDPNKQHWADKAIARLKQQQAQQPAAPPKPTKTYDSRGFADSDDADYHQLYNRKQYYQQQQLTAAQQRAASAYVDPNTEPGSLYNVAQNMNWNMVTGQKLTPKQQKIHDDMMDAMHNVGHNVTLTRYDHAGMVDSMLKQLGAGTDYTKLSPSQLKKALVGQTMGENKMISTTTNDFANAPRHVQQLFQNRAVKINYKTKAGVQGLLMPIGSGGDQGELVLAPTNGGKNKAPRITDVRFTGKSVYRAYNGRTYPQIEVDVEWD